MLLNLKCEIKKNKRSNQIPLYFSYICTFYKRMKKQEKKLGLWLLVFVAIGSMMGAGIFNAPRDLIHVSNPPAALITWAIGGLGALMLALVFIYLNARKPELTSGIFSYAQKGFGDYMGFNSAWGYWCVSWLGNVSYFILFFKTLNDLLGEHALSPWACFIAASLMLWTYYFIITAGIREGAMLNLIVNIAKLVPLILVILLGVSLIDRSFFALPEWTSRLASTGEATTVSLQIKEAMAFVLWCFIGVEAASVLSGRAKKQKTVRQATIVSLLFVLFVYILITFITMSSVPAGELKASYTPLALTLSKTAIGKAGATIVQLGILISIIGASLSWILLSVETMYTAAKHRVLPRFMAKENKNKTPVNALLITQVLTQIFLFAILLPEMNKTYVTAITVGTTLALIPYLLSSLFAVKVSLEKEQRFHAGHFVVAILGVVYSLYVIYAVGILYLFSSFTFYIVGAFVFYWAKHEQKSRIKKWEWLIMFLLTGVTIAFTLLLILGKVSI